MEGMNAKNFDEVFATLIAQGISPDELFDCVCKQVIVASTCLQSVSPGLDLHCSILHMKQPSQPTECLSFREWRLC